MTHAPQPSMQWYFQLPRNRLKKSSTDRLNLKEMLYIYTRGYYSDFKYRHWNYEVIPVVPTRMYLGGKYTKWSQPQKKKIAGDVLEGKIGKKKKKKDTEEIIYIIKRDFEIQTQRFKKEREREKVPGRN